MVCRQAESPKSKPWHLHYKALPCRKAGKHLREQLGKTGKHLGQPASTCSESECHSIHQAPLQKCLPESWHCRGKERGMRFPAWCRHTTLAISCWHCLLLALANADRASLPVISHLGVKLFSVGCGAPSTLPVSPCWNIPSWASPLSSVRFLLLEESEYAGNLRPGLCLTVTALTTLATRTPGFSGRLFHRPCFRLKPPRRPAELSESLEPSWFSSSRAFF